MLNMSWQLTYIMYNNCVKHCRLDLKLNFNIRHASFNVATSKNLQQQSYMHKIVVAIKYSATNRL
jgi:hypothetical protein